jgi:hypothetical protein
MSASTAVLPLPTPLVWVPPKLTDHGTLLAMANVAGSVVPMVAALLQVSLSCTAVPPPPTCPGH